jgi:hypothetical protein
MVTVLPIEERELQHIVSRPSNNDPHEPELSERRPATVPALQPVSGARAPGSQWAERARSIDWKKTKNERR